jgi:ATP-dependent Zn protease
MDGFEENTRIVIVAATNLIQNIDPALQRAKRFDRKIEVQLPNALARFKILKIHLKDKNNKIDEKSLMNAAFALDGCSGADIENLINLAALQAVRVSNMSGNRKNPSLSNSEFEDAIKNFINERKNSMQSPRITSYSSKSNKGW